MKPLLFSAIVFPFAAILHADPGPEAKAFLHVEKATTLLPGPEMAEFPDGALLPELKANLKECIVDIPKNPGPDAELVTPDHFRGFQLDLNGDGEKEFFVNNPGLRGSSGSAVVVFSKIGSDWIEILDFQGMHLLQLAAKPGWPDLVSISKGGGGCYTKCHYVFKDGCYTDTLWERFNHGKTTKIPFSPEMQLDPGDMLRLRPGELHGLFHGEYEIDAKGMANLPKLGQVHIGGLTREEALKKISAACTKLGMQPSGSSDTP